ncbi:MAG TPA: YkgJ family cysteine cluster protein [Pyrinomonadaceae bacterium]|nr:YkgJ family cysteine cluster protein [Pyrinomonadaceae bacterium]
MKQTINSRANKSAARSPKSNKRRLLEDRLTAAKRLRAVEDARFRARQAQGKLRRFVSANFRKQEVIDALSLRRGECNRCGACCEILLKCPFLKKHGDGTSTCGIYEDRPNQCRLFPIERRDLDEVRGQCSFYFIEKPIKLERAS